MKIAVAEPQLIEGSELEDFVFAHSRLHEIRDGRAHIEGLAALMVEPHQIDAAFFGKAPLARLRDVADFGRGDVERLQLLDAAVSETGSIERLGIERGLVVARSRKESERTGQNCHAGAKRAANPAPTRDAHTNIRKDAPHAIHCNRRAVTCAGGVAEALRANEGRQTL